MSIEDPFQGKIDKLLKERKQILRQMSSARALGISWSGLRIRIIAIEKELQLLFEELPEELEK